MSEQEMVEAGRATGSTTEQDVTMNADAPKRALSSEDEAKLAELDQAIEKFRSQKRWSDVIRRTLAKVDIVIDVQQKVDLLVEAGELFIERSSNQAEAIKCFEKVLGFDPENEGAIQRLKEMYEKRRDWERWLQVMQREVALLDPSEQAGRYLEIAHLANERVRKPQTRIDVWECVLRQDPQHPEAVENLVKLYEQVRNYEALAAVLETHIDMVDNTQQKKQLLQKLGSIYADRLDRGEESVSAFQRLLALDPSDRRAQEQLKRRYLALRQWEELEEFYAVSGKWDELIRVLEREAEGTSLDEHDKVGVLLKVAALWEDKKERPDRAIKAYERIREVEPNNVQAAQALIPIYQKAEEYPKLAEVLEVRIGALDSNVDVTERTQLLTTTARVYEEKLTQPERALELALLAFSCLPSSEEIRADLERLTLEVKAWPRAVDVYSEAIEASTSPDLEIDLRIGLGRIFMESGDMERAIEQFQFASQARPESVEVVLALGELYKRTGRHDDLLRMYSERIEVESDSELRRKLMYARAEVCEKELRDSTSATEAYRQIVDEFGDAEQDAFAALARLHELREEWSELASVIEKQLLTSEQDSKIERELKLRLARVYYQRMGDRSRAIDIYRELFVVETESDDATADLESMLEDSQAAFAAAQILESVYESSERWEKLAGVCRVLWEGSQDPSEQFAYLHKAAHTYATFLDDAHAAFDIYERSLHLFPDSKETLDSLEALAESSERVKDFVSLLQRIAAESVTFPEIKYSLLMKAADCADDNLSDAELSIACLTSLLELQSIDLSEVFSRLTTILRREEKWGLLVSVLQRKVEATTDVDERISILSEIAELYSGVLGSPRDAIPVLSDILSIDPENVPSIQQLSAHYEALEMWGELADALEAQLALVQETATRVELMLRLAEVREVRMQSVEAAIDTYREVLALDPMQDKALHVLERLLQSDDYRMLAVDILRPVYRDTQKYPELVSLCELECQCTASAERRVELWHEIAELQEVALESPRDAFLSYSYALASDPGSAWSQDQLERMATVIGCEGELAQVYEKQAEVIEDSVIASTLLLKSARIREIEADGMESAIQLYQRVLHREPHNVDAADALERLYHAAERYEELAKVYLAKCRIAEDADARKDYLFRAASIYEDILDQAGEAVVVYQSILDEDGEEIRAIDKLIELYLRLEKFEDLLHVYQQKIDLIFDVDEKKRLLVEVGAVYEREVGDVDKAVFTYQRILEIDPDDLVAIGRLDALFEASANWQELLGVLEREAELSADASESVGYRFRIASLWHHKLDDEDRAVDIYREILDFLPGHDASIHALESIVSEGKNPVFAAVALEDIYRERQDWERLVWVLEVQVSRESDPLRKVELLHQIADLQELQSHNPGAAFEAHGRALELDPGDELTLGSLERLADAADAWQRLAELYDSQVEALRASQPDAMADMACRAAQVYDERLGDINFAIERYARVLEHDSSRASVLESLDRLYQSAERWDELAQVIAKQIEFETRVERLLDLRYRLGEIEFRQLGRIEAAVEQYREVFALDLEHDDALRSLEEIFAIETHALAVSSILENVYRSRDEWLKVIGVNEVQLQHESDESERVLMLQRMAELAEEQADDPRTAFALVQRCLLEDPLHDHTQLEVERLAAMIDGWAQLAQTYSEIAEKSEHGEARLWATRRLAEVYEEQLGDIARAEEAYRYLLRLKTDDEEALDALQRIYDAYGAHEALAEVLKRRVELSTYAAEKVDLSFQLGQVLDNDLGRPDEALGVYRKIVHEWDPHHVESLRELESIFIRKQDWPQLFQVYEKQMEAEVDETQQISILSSMANLAARYLDDARRAVEIWKRVLEIGGEDSAALHALSEIYARHENWEDLVDVLEREASISEDNATRIALHADLGRIWRYKLGRERNALDSWERILEIDPTCTDALFQIADIYRVSSQTAELVDTLHRIVDVGVTLLDEAALEDVYLHLGHLYGFELEQPFDAVEAYTRVLEMNPRSLSAMNALEKIYRDETQWEDAIRIKELRLELLDDPQDRIEALLSIARMWDQQVGDRQRGASAFDRVLEIDPLHEYSFKQVEELYQEAERWDALIEMYLGRVEACHERGEKVILLRRIAEVYEKEIGDRERAFDALQLAWTEDYGNARTSADLERLAGVTQKWNELLDTANQSLAEAEAVEEKIAICLCCARWYGQYLGHPEYAIPYYQQILSLDPVNLPAMRQMAELHRATHQWETLAQVLSRLAEITNDNVERGHVYVQLGDLAQEKLNKPENATAFFVQALEADPHCVPALSALEVIYENSGAWDDLVRVLQTKIEAQNDVTEQVASGLKLAQIYEGELEQIELAVQCLKQVLELDADCLAALRGLQRMYEVSERWPDLFAVLESEYEIVTSERDRVELLLRMASMLEEHFVSQERAAEKYEAVLDIDPAHERALVELERLYQHMQQWSQLVQSYERHVDAVGERQEKVVLYKRTGEVLSREIGDIDAAVDAYLNALSLDEGDVDALDALSQLYEKREEHHAALEIMEQLARLDLTADRAVNLYARIGALMDSHLGDRVGALEYYQRALDLDPSHAASLEAVRIIHLESSDWIAAVTILDKEIQCAASDRIAAQRLVDLGRLCDDKLDDAERAVAAFEHALERDATNEDAALPLARKYIERDAFAKALPLLQSLVLRSEKREPEEQYELCSLLGGVALRLEQYDEGIRAYSRAYELDSAHLPTLLGLAAAYFGAAQWEHAFKFYQMVLVHHRDGLSSAEVADLFYHLGVIKNEQGQRRKAMNMFDKALEEDGEHRATLDALVALHAMQREWEQVIHYKTQILPLLSDDERFDFLVSIGDDWRERVRNIDQAIESYVEASLVKADDHRVLHKLLLTYQESKRWEDAIDIIERISELDARQEAKAKYAYTIGVILRDELHSLDAALERFNEALDLDIEQLKPFEAINKILTQQKDWKGLERAFRKMLHRVLGTGKSELEFNLWHNLGLIYRDRMQNLDSAAEAFRMASQSAPDNVTEHQILAELYISMPSRLNEAITEHQWLIRNNPERVESYRCLYRLYFDARAYDRAWCVAAALSFLRRADEEQQRFFEQYRVQGVLRPQARLDHERWARLLFHDDEDLLVGKMFEILTLAVRSLRAMPDKNLNLQKRYEVDPASSTVTFARTFGFAAQVLNLTQTPRLFLRQDVPGRLSAVAGAEPPACICGSTLLSGYSPQDLAFLLGRHLTYHRDEHMVRTYLSTTQELKTLLLAGLRLVGMGAADGQVEATARQLGERLGAAQIEALRVVAKRFLDAGARTDVKRWMRSVELTACRAGFLLCNDLATAARMIQDLPPEGANDLPAKTKLMDVVVYSVSDKYFELREALGVQVQV